MAKLTINGHHVLLTFREVQLETLSILNLQYVLLSFGYILYQGYSFTLRRSDRIVA